MSEQTAHDLARDLVRADEMMSMAIQRDETTHAGEWLAKREAIVDQRYRLLRRELVARWARRRAAA